MHDDDITRPESRVNKGIRLPQRRSLERQTHRAFSALAGLSLGLGLAQRPEKPENDQLSTPEAHSDSLPILPPVQASFASRMTQPEVELPSARARATEMAVQQGEMSRQEANYLLAMQELLGGPIRVVEDSTRNPVRNGELTSYRVGRWRASRPFNDYEYHTGIDITSPLRKKGQGTPIHPPGPALVIQLGVYPGWPKPGNRVTLVQLAEDGQIVKHSGSHNQHPTRSQLERLSKGWYPVTPDSIIARMGTSGNLLDASDPITHVHWDKRICTYRCKGALDHPRTGRAVDPTPDLLNGAVRRLVDISNAQTHDRAIVERVQQTFNALNRAQGLGLAEIAEDGVFGEEVFRAWAATTQRLFALQVIQEAQEQQREPTWRYAQEGRGSNGITR